MIDPVLANEKAVKTAINKIKDKKYVIIDAPEAVEDEEAEAIED